ncbi:hypothetical protein ABPG74_009556 [Tetrahymena malaccensis]
MDRSQEIKSSIISKKTHKSFSGTEGTPLADTKKVQFDEQALTRSKNNSTLDSSSSTSAYIELNLKRVSQIQYFEKEFSFEKFTSGDIRQISLTVLGTESKLFKYKTYKIEVKSPFFPDIHCFRRYNEFHALYKVLKLKYQNIQLPNFPSKYTVINRTEKRRVAFHRILNGILEIAQQHHGQIQKNILQLLYVFLTKDLSGKQTNKVEISSNQHSGSIDDMSEFSIKQIIEEYGNDVCGDIQSINSEDSFEQKQNSKFLEENEERYNQTYGNTNELSLSKSNQSDSQFSQSQQQVNLDFYLRDKSSSQQSKQLSMSQQSQLTDSEMQEALNCSFGTGIRERSIAQQPKKLSIPPEAVIIKSGSQAAPSSLITHRNQSDEKNKSKSEIRTLDKASQMVIIEKFANIKEEKDYCGYIQVSLQNDTKKVLYGRIVQNTLQLFHQIFDNHFACLISIYEAQIQFHPQNSHIIEIFHGYDSKKIQICLQNDKFEDYYLDKEDKVKDINTFLADFIKMKDQNSFLDDEKNRGNIEKYFPPSDLQRWLVQLQIASQKKQDINLNDFVFEPIGKVYLSIHEIINFKYIPPNSTVFIRIKSSPFIFQTKENISDSPKWKQDFIFPFSNSYGLITLEVISMINKGWIKEKFTEKILASVSIQIADILGHNQDTVFKKIVLPLDNTEQRNKQLVKDGVQDKKEQEMQIVVSLRNLSKFESIFAESSNNIYDGVKMSEQQKSIMRYYKINFNRYKNLCGNVFLFIWSFNDIFYQKYPKFSNLMIVLILLYIWNANLNNILQHLIALFFFIIIVHNPKIYPFYQHFTQKHLFSEKHPSYHEPQLYTKKMNDYIKMSQCLSKIKKFKNDIIVEEQIQFTLSQTYQQLKKSFYLLHEWISVVVNYCEKFKNLLTWKDQNRTYQFFIFLIFLYVVFTHIPIRFMLFFGSIYNFYIGRFVYQKRYDINKQQGKNLIIYVYKKYWPEYRSWEQIEHQKFPNEQIKKALIDDGLVHFYLWITNESLQQYDTPNKLMMAIATVPKKLFMNKVEGPHQSTEIYKELQKNSKLRLSKYLTTVKIWKNFLYNIPSDCYRILHPKMI